MIFKFNLSQKNFDANVKSLFEIINEIDKLDKEQKNTARLLESDINEYRHFYDTVCKKFKPTITGEETKAAPIKKSNKARKEDKVTRAFLVHNIDTDEEFVSGYGVDESNRITFVATNEPSDKAPSVFFSKKTAVEVAQFANRTRGVKSFRAILCKNYSKA